MTTTTSATSPSDVYAAINAKNSSLAPTSSSTEVTASDQNERFLKLLTAQLNNQDPLNPMDNAEMTSQVAQISTVSGVEKLNKSLEAMTSQFLQMQVMQGAALVGKGVVANGNALTMDSAGKAATGAYELAAASTATTLEVRDAAKNLVYSQSLGAQTKGQHDFSLDAEKLGLSKTGAYTFNVVAQSASGGVAVTNLVRDTVAAVNTSNNTLTLELTGGGTVAYSDVKAFK